MYLSALAQSKSQTIRTHFALANARIRAGERVSVLSKKKPNNPKDAEAIAFERKAADECVRVGYIVCEALDSVHEARDRNKIEMYILTISSL